MAGVAFSDLETDLVDLGGRTGSREAETGGCCFTRSVIIGVWT